jgi:hypothetical protein
MLSCNHPVTDLTIEAQINWEETYYWPMIKEQGEKLAQKFGSLPKPRGPSNGVSQEERRATKELVIAKKFRRI